MTVAVALPELFDAVALPKLVFVVALPKLVALPVLVVAPSSSG